MKCSLCIPNFLVEISSLSHSVLFLYLFALITEAFLSLLAILWNSSFGCLYLSFSPLLFASLLFTGIKPQHSENQDHGIWSHHFMGNRWGKSGNNVIHFWGGSKITAYGDCLHKIKRCLLLRRKVVSNLHSILKSRDVTLPTKVCLVKAMVFPVVMYGCESWTIKKTEGQRIDAFELWCWRRLLRVPCTARRSNQSILKEISLEYSLGGLMLKLKLQYFGHLMPRTNLLGKDPNAGKD